FSALLAYALDPVVSLVERAKLPGRWRVPRGVAAGLVVVALVLVAGAALFEAVPRLVRQLARFASTAPAALASLAQQLRAYLESRGWGGLSKGGPNSPVTSLLGTLQHASASLAGRLVGSLGGLASSILIPLFAVYILVDREHARAGLLDLVPR